MARRPLGAHGSKLLRDLFVCLLAALIASPLLLLAPRATLAVLLLWALLWLTPLPRRLLRWLDGRVGPPPRALKVAVLGGGFDKGGVLSARSLRRVRHGVALAQERGAALMLCGGTFSGSGSGSGGAGVLVEAEEMARQAAALGFGGTLTPEVRSLTTFENLLVLAALAGGPVVVVTCPHHRVRVALLARELGAAHLSVVGYPVAELPAGPGLAVEGSYECAILVWLLLRRVLSSLRLLPPLGAASRPHLSK